MVPTCNICANEIPAINDRYKLTAKLLRKKLSIAKVLNDNWGVSVSKEQEHWMICRACSSSLSSASTKRQEFDVAISRLYNNSAPTVYIGRKLREFITTLRGEVSISTPSSTSSCAPSPTPRGHKRSISTCTCWTPRNHQEAPRSYSFCDSQTIMVPTCNICANEIPAINDRYKLTAKLQRKKLSIAEVLNDNWGVSVSKEQEHWMICRACSSSLSSASTKRQEFDIAISRLYNNSAPTAYIGCKLRDFITTLRGEVSISTPSSTSSCTPSPTPRGHKRSISTSTCWTPRSHLKKSRLSRSSEKKTQTPRFRTRQEIESPPGLRGQGNVTSKLAAKYVKGSKYGKACRLLKNKSTAFTREVQKIVEEATRAEIRNICKRSTRSVWRSSAKGKKLQSYRSFSWKEVLSEAKRQCPFLHAAIIGAATANRKGYRPPRGSSGIARHMKPAVGAIFGMLAFMGSPQKMRLLQELISIELWLSNCGRETFRKLNGLGMCTDIQSTTACINTVIKEFDHDILEKKKELEACEAPITVSRKLFSQEAAPENDYQVVNEEELEGAYMDDSLSVSSIEERAEFSHSSVADETNHVESSISSNKTDGKEATCTSESTEETTSVGRTGKSPDNLDETIEYSLLDETETTKVGYTIVFDNVNQMTHARYGKRAKDDEMLNMVQAYAAFDRVPSYHLGDTPPTANDILQIDPQVYLPNDSDETLLRQEYTVIVQRILTQLMPCFQRFAEHIEDHIPHPYLKESEQKSKIVPLGVLKKDETKTSDMVDILLSYHDYVPCQDGKPVTTVLYGDGLGCERARDAQNARINSTNSWNRLEGLHPAIQEWHKRGLLLEDTYKLLYDVRSSRAVGTLSYIKNKFRHGNVKPDKVMHTFNAATDLLQLSTEAYVVAAACVHVNIDDPSKMPTDLPEGIEGLQYFQDVVSSVVDIAFQRVEKPENENQAYPYCICHTDTEDDMVFCENPSCGRGSWFHLSCMNMSPEDVPDVKYFCSIECSQASQKKRGVISHTTDDHVFQYSRAMLSRGLGERVRYDAIRENDGDRIISHWRFDMIEFYEKHHPKYFIEGFHLLTDMNGGVSERVAHQMKWNRTVNVRGGSGHNTSMDLAMEHLNKEFKLAVKSCGGNITPSTINRYSRMLGIRKDFQSKFDAHLTKTKRMKRLRGSRNMQEHTLELAKLLLDHNCLVQIPGRSHSGFSDFVFKHALTQQDKFIERIEKHKKKRAQRMDIAQANVSFS